MVGVTTLCGVEIIRKCTEHVVSVSAPSSVYTKLLRTSHNSQQVALLLKVLRVDPT
jgi:hypothetical protein